MKATVYDVIVVGARCAGSPTAMLLARRGYRVLLVDRASFPSDTVSTHLLHPPGVAALERWGLLDRLQATGCPPIDRYTFEFGPLVVSGTPSTHGPPSAFCPRRTVLDQILVEAAVEAGAEFREQVFVQELLFDDSRVVGVRGRSETERSRDVHARVVVGADGAHSRVAEAVSAQRYRELPVMSAGYYAYWSGLALDGALWRLNPPVNACGLAPTHDGLTLVLSAWPHTALPAVKQDLEGSYLRALHDLCGDLVDGAHRETRVVGTSHGNHFHVPYGPGWALVGDAGYLKDPVTAQGISDAFADAELLVTALSETFTGRTSFADAMVGYQARRDARVLPMYEFTTQIAPLQPPPPELQGFLASCARDQAAADRFAGFWAGVVSPDDVFTASVSLRAEA